MATRDAAIGPPGTEAVLDLLRANGGRVTATRRATVEVLLGAGEEHLQAEEIVDRVRSRYPEVAESTIYRTLGALEELGVVAHVHLGHGPSTFHLAHSSHQHLVCRLCSTVVEVPDEVFDDLAGRVERDYGFAIQPHHFAMLGECAACRAAGAQPPR